MTGFAAWWVSTQPAFIEWLAGLPKAESLRLLWNEGGETVVYLPWQILFYSAAASLAGIVVSLFTRPVAEDKLNRFYQLSRTPVQPGEVLLQPCTLPVETPVVNRAMLFTACGLEIPVPSRTSVIGFGVVWLLIGGMIAAFVWIAA